jgi:hypothetical protein
VLAQTGAAAVVVGSYFVAEALRKRRRAKLIMEPGTSPVRRSGPVSGPGQSRSRRRVRLRAD